MYIGKIYSKILLVLILNLFTVAILFSQASFNSNKLISVNIPEQKQFNFLYSDFFSGFNASSKPSFINDTIFKNGKLFYDDTEYNIRSSVWRPVVLTTGVNVLTWSVDRFITRSSYSKVGLKSWKYNLTHDWVWDTDPFQVDFLGHPFSGAMFFNTARSSGYSFVQSFPFAVFGSVQWKYFGENDLPTINDLITTSVSGTAYGEMLYRLSSNILDDTKVGSERVFREIFAGIIDPVRGINRLLQGRTFRVTSKEIYQKEPLTISIGGGIQKLNKVTSFGTGLTSELVSLSLVYGDPFEKRKRKPFDFFESKIVLDNGDVIGKSFVDNLSAYGLLFGKNAQPGKMKMLIGIFQHYDYFDNSIFELGNLFFSGGIISKLPLGQKSFLNTNLHLGLVPFGGYSIKPGPDTAPFRDFNYGGGAGAKIESTLDFRNFVNINIFASYYWMDTYSGIKENNFIGIFKPTILFRVYKNMQLGFQYFVYTNDKFAETVHTSNLRSSEQKFVLLFNIGNNNSLPKSLKHS